MDYSAITSDPEHPTDASPWGSPRADRTMFPTSSTTSDIPSSPLPGQEQSADSTDGDQEVDRQSPGLAAQFQNAQLGDSGYSEGQSPSATQQSPNAEQRAQVPARYQTGARQNSRPPAPVPVPAPTYKIQGKITGLERTGKKDPILRFDVHVG